MNVLKFLEENVMPATGCTEPIAVGYAVALAYKALFKDKKVLQPKIEDLVKISIKTDRDVYKNALAIAIPGTNGQKGMKIASAMGLYSNAKKGLNLFSDLTNEKIQEARGIVSSKKVEIEEIDDTSDKSKLDIQVRLEYMLDGKKNKSYVRLEGMHDNIVDLEVNGQKEYSGNFENKENNCEKVPDTIDELLDVIENLSRYEREVVYKGIEMNNVMAEEGLNSVYAGYAQELEKLIETGILGEGLISDIKVRAAAAGDARMGGAPMPVMSTSGSGNQGITALIPIAVLGEYLGESKKKVSEAAMLSHLVTKYVSERSGYLSAMCGCAIKAGIGAAAGTTYLLGGDKDQINNAINIMAANITGMICDGAKEGCALKLSTAAAVATESAYVAMNGWKVSSSNGIVHKRAEDTIYGIGRISEAMVPVDSVIVELMQSKNSYHV